MRFAPQKCMPEKRRYEKFYPLIQLAGIKLMILYYARQLGEDFSFGRIKDPSSDAFPLFVGQSVSASWNSAARDSLYPEMFEWDTFLDGYIDYEAYDFTEEDIIEKDYSHVLGLDSVLSCCFLASSCDCDDTPYEPSGDIVGDISKVFFDRFISPKKLPFPDDDGGRMAEMLLDASIDMLWTHGISDGVSYNFLCETTFGLLSLMYDIFLYDAGEDEENSTSGYFSCFSMIHPYGQSILSFLDSFSDKEDVDFDYFMKSKEILSDCLELIKTGKCDTGEDPDWYDYNINNDGKSFSLSIIYRTDIFDNISVVVLAVSLLKQVMEAVYCKVEDQIQQLHMLQK